MKVEEKTSLKPQPSKRSKAEVHQMLKKRIADKRAEEQAQISTAAKAAAKATKGEKIVRVDPDKSALGLNDPNSPATKEKLRAALKSGLVKFDPRERKVLAKILK